MGKVMLLFPYSQHLTRSCKHKHNRTFDKKTVEDYYDHWKHNFNSYIQFKSRKICHLNA